MTRPTRSPSSYPRRGSQTPTRLVVPRYDYSAWRDCHELNAIGGLEMLEWQDGVMDGWLGRNAYDRWASPTCGGSVPRQNGKTLGVVEPRINYGMVVLGEQVIYTSHLQKTSTETFEDMASFFDGPKLRKYVKDIKTALGREQILLKNGARIKFLARTRNGGRGQHGDLLVFDEALELSAESQASFLPAISASRNPQTIYVSTPPTRESDSPVFRAIRARALDGSSERTAWFEWSVDEIGDVRDRDRWYATNPSLGVLIQESTVAGEVEQMDDETFARERLGWWSPLLSLDYVIDRDEWLACADMQPREGGTVTYAVKFSPDGLVGAIAVCHRYAEGAPFVYVVDVLPLSGGLQPFVDALAPHAHDAAQIVIDGQSNAQALNDRLLSARVPRKVIVRPRAGDVIAACSSFVSAVREGAITHYGQPDLDRSATRTTRRAIGTHGGWGFQSTDEADATPVEAACLAYWGAMTTKRKPGRKAVVRC